LAVAFCGGALAITCFASASTAFTSAVFAVTLGALASFLGVSSHGDTSLYAMVVLEQTLCSTCTPFITRQA